MTKGESTFAGKGCEDGDVDDENKDDKDDF